jgi:hypothetical protein
MSGERLPSEGRRFLAVNPGATVLGIAPSGTGGLLFELVPHAERIGELSRSALVNAVTRSSWVASERGIASTNGE